MDTATPSPSDRFLALLKPIQLEPSELAALPVPEPSPESDPEDQILEPDLQRGLRVLTDNERAAVLLLRAIGGFRSYGFRRNDVTTSTSIPSPTSG